MLNTDFDFENVPNGWALCFNEECKMKDECLHHHFAEDKLGLLVRLLIVDSEK